MSERALAIHIPSNTAEPSVPTDSKIQFMQIGESAYALYLTTPNGERYRIIPDDPELDATDGAHPAWWRGHDHAVKAICQKINEILDGKDNGEGVSSEHWESVRRKLLNAAYLSPAGKN